LKKGFTITESQCEDDKLEWEIASKAFEEAFLLLDPLEEHE
jgi:hypothetical protein